MRTIILTVFVSLLSFSSIAIAQTMPADADPAYRKSALASSFVAALELARQGKVELSQDAPFDDLRLSSNT